MIDLPTYVKAAAGERADAWLRTNIATIPLRLAPGADAAKLDAPVDPALAAIARAAAALPDAATLATIARVGAAAEAVGRVGFQHAPPAAGDAPDAAALARLTPFEGDRP